MGMGIDRSRPFTGILDWSGTEYEISAYQRPRMPNYLNIPPRSRSQNHPSHILYMRARRSRSIYPVSWSNRII